MTVVGRFRGRNLYGDLPDAPGKSRWDFVLQSANAAIWVTGRRPKGDGFDLNIDNRVDTGRWLEVAGVVKAERGLVRVEADAIRAAQPPAQTAQPEALVKVPSVSRRPKWSSARQRKAKRTSRPTRTSACSSRGICARIR